MSIHTLSAIDLESVKGGAGQQGGDFISNLRTDLKARYKSFVCDGSGLVGGGELAKQLYGDAADADDRARSAKAITMVCNGGSKLPAKAPPFPFE